MCHIDVQDWPLLARSLYDFITAACLCIGRQK
jgi:hypothetical protein